MGEHVHCQGYDINVSGPFTVTEEGSFDTVRSCQKSQLCIRNAGASVVMRMKGNHHVFTGVKVFTHIFDLIRKNMGH